MQSGWCSWGGARRGYAGVGSLHIDSATRKKAAWHSDLFTEHACRESAVMNDDGLIVGGRGLAACIDPVTGRAKWTREIDLKFENHAAMNGDAVLIGDFLLERSSGKLIADMSRKAKYPRTLGWCDILVYRDGFIHTISRDEITPTSLYIRPNGEFSELPHGEHGIITLDSDAEIALTLAGADPNIVSRINVQTGEILWSFDPPRTTGGYSYISGWPALGKKYFYASVFNDSLLAVDLETGREAWIAGAQSKTEWDRPLGYVVPSQVLVSGRYAVITDFSSQPESHGLRMACFDAGSGAPLWDVQLRNFCQHMCILGAYIFGTQDDHPVAWSLESGQIVWEGEGFIKPAYVLAHGNRVIYETVASEFVCYEF